MTLIDLKRGELLTPEQCDEMEKSGDCLIITFHRSYIPALTFSLILALFFLILTSCSGAIHAENDILTGLHSNSDQYFYGQSFGKCWMHSLNNRMRDEDLL